MTDIDLMIDDLQGYDAEAGRHRGHSDYCNIATFIENTFKTMSGTDRLLWVCMDSAQQTSMNPPDNEKTTSFFTKKFLFRTLKRTFTIPVVELSDILRNSEEITHILDDARNQQTKDKGLDTSRMVQNIHSGHEITSEAVVEHRLQKNTPDQHYARFVCDRVSVELHTLTSSAHHTLHTANIAVLFESDWRLYEYGSALEQRLSKVFGVATQTIEEQITTSNNHAVIMDTVKNVNSFECPIVLMVTNGLGGVSRIGQDYVSYYNLFTRARTKLVIINCNWSTGPSSTHNDSNVEVVEWQLCNNEFVKVP